MTDNANDPKMNGTQDPILNLLERKKNRLIRVVLGTKERLYDDDSGKGESEDPDAAAFRKVVLDEVNDFFEQVADIISTLQDDRSVMVNQLFLDKLDELKGELRGLQQVS